MSALSVDADSVKVRRLAAEAIATARSYYPGLAPWQRLGRARDSLAANSAEFLLAGELDHARRHARAYELVRTRVTRILNDLTRGASA